MATPYRIQPIQGYGQTAEPGKRFSAEVVVRAYDTDNNPMAGVALVWSVPNQSEPSGLFDSTGSGARTANTDADGYGRSGGLTANTNVGSWQGLVQFVSSPGINWAWGMTNATINPVPRSIVITSGGNQKAAYNSAYGAIVAQVRDQNNAAMRGVEVHFSVPAGHGTFVGGSLTALVNTDNSGNATAPTFTANNVAGPFTLTLDLPSYATVPATTTTLTNVNPAVAITLQVNGGNNQQTTVGNAFGQALTVKVFNELGGVVQGATVTFTSPASGPSCTFPVLFSVYNGISNAQGIASSSTPIANGLSGSYSVAATCPGSTSAQFNLSNGASYLPEVCSPNQAPTGAAQYGSQVGTWSNLNEALSPTSSTGAYATLDVYEASRILLCSTIPPADLALMDNNAIITKIVISAQAKTGRSAPSAPSMEWGLYNGANIFGASSTITPSVENVWENRSRTFTSPALTPAQLKAGNYGIGVTSSTGADGAGSAYIRAAKMYVCYTNPGATGGDENTVSLGMCEV